MAAGQTCRAGYVRPRAISAGFPGVLHGTVTAEEAKMPSYRCGNPICKGPIESDCTDWPLRCGRCNQQCYPENVHPDGPGGSSIRTQDGAFGLPTTVLMIEGPSGSLVPFRWEPPPRPAPAEVSPPEPAQPWFCGSCKKEIPNHGGRWPVDCPKCGAIGYPENALVQRCVALVRDDAGVLSRLERAAAAGSAPCHCGNPVCKRPLRGDGWPRRCEACGWDCCPDDAWRPAAALLTPGPEGKLVPVRSGKKKKKKSTAAAASGPFCASCTADSTPESPGTVFSLRGNGRHFYGGIERCERCNSAVEVLWIIFYWFPIAPLGAFRVHRAHPAGGGPTRLHARETQVRWGQVYAHWAIALAIVALVVGMLAAVVILSAPPPRR